jgi:hypothetical protein
MFESKPMASLTSRLLARKGDARPAMRRSYIPMTPVAQLPLSVQRDASDEVEDDLGWNDIGAESVPAVRHQQERIVQSFESRPVSEETVRRAIELAPRAAKAAFTLRLDPERHLRLRLASAVAKKSSQRLVTEALDAFLAQQEGLDTLVDEARRQTPGIAGE